jgi:hypothetical protein
MTLTYMCYGKIKNKVFELTIKKNTPVCCWNILKLDGDGLFHIYYHVT